MNGHLVSWNRIYRVKCLFATLLLRIQQGKSSRESSKNWARSNQKIGACPGLDPGRWTRLLGNKAPPWGWGFFTCTRCSGKIKLISVIEDSEIVKKILKHLRLWDQKARPPHNGSTSPLKKKAKSSILPRQKRDFLSPRPAQYCPLPESYLKSYCVYIAYAISWNRFCSIIYGFVKSSPWCHCELSEAISLAVTAWNQEIALSLRSSQ